MKLMRVTTNFAGPPAAPAPRFLVTERQCTVVVPTPDIEWIASAGNYVELNLAGACHLLRGTMSAIERRLDPRLFLRVHRRTIVNVTAVAEIRRGQNEWEAVLRNGTRRAIARGKRRQVLAWLRGAPCRIAPRGHETRSS